MIIPIPEHLLCEEIELLCPADDGYEHTFISSVRVLFTSRVSEYSADINRNTSEITVYYDCVNSLPNDISFEAGMLIIHNNLRYEIISAETFCADSPHHVKITARLV